MTMKYRYEALITLTIIACIKKTLEEPVKGQCRSSLGIFNQSDFQLHECAWCYFYLFQNNSLYPFGKYLGVIRNTTYFPIGTQLVADSENQTSRKNICSTLLPDECTRWTLCCQAANECCAQQLKTESGYSNRTCRSTWDGYGCWGMGSPGSINKQPCPSFLSFSIPTQMAVKTCMADGTWLQKNNREWTDYTPCLQYENLKITLYISLGCQIASLTLLIPSLYIFLHFKALRSQHRIRLHINFFISFIFSCTFTALWNMFVTYDKLTSKETVNTLIYKNTISCKLLSFLKIYFTGTNYAWMFCEGFYLYKLIANAFSPPKRLIVLYIAGWGIPFVYAMTYACIRITMADESCWSVSLGGEEWILYTPNLMCLVANIFFLCSILRILLTQLQAHPNEPSNFRRALKATFVLIPLFGVQLVVTIYRIPQTMAGALHYERFSEVISNSQGFVVALIFCFCNGEVASQIKRSWRRMCWDKMSGPRKFNNTLSLNFNNSTMSQRTADHIHSRRNSLEPCLRPLCEDASASTLQSQL